VRVLVYTADVGRCGHRLIWPAEALRAQGADIGLIRPDRPDDLPDLDHADVIVMQRPMLRRFLEPVARAQANGTTVVVDIDDDFRALHRDNAVWWLVHPSRDPDVNWHHLDAMCAMADLVTVTTPALARRYGGHGRVQVIPNHVPASYLEILSCTNPVPVVGWTGFVATHPHDLQSTRGAVGRAIARAGAEFAVVGPADGVREGLVLADAPRASGPVPLDVYPYEVARLDIGIVPLAATAFNEAKSTLKGLEFAALGVPFVKSDTGPYRSLPVGELARKPKDWEREVRRLVESEQLRADRAGFAREWAATQTIEGNCDQWWDAWTGARGKTRGRTAVLV
jgi:hypothetical protein